MDVNINQTEHSKELSLKGLFEDGYLSRTQKRLTESLEIPFFIIDYKGNTVIEHDPAVLFCDTMDIQKQFYKECQMSHALAAAKSAIQEKPNIFFCPENMVNIAIPIIVKKQYLGAIIGGPIRCSDPENLEDVEQSSIIGLSATIREHRIPEYNSRRIQAISETVFQLFQEINAKESVLLDAGRIEHERTHRNALRKKNAELMQKLEEEEFRSLKIKIPSQLMINLFSAITNMAVLENAERTESMMIEFSSVLRFYLQDRNERISLKEELDQVERYLRVVKKQLADNYDYRIQCQKNLEMVNLPAFSIFPFAVYMIDRFLPVKNSKATLFIDAEERERYCRISVQLSGDGVYSEYRMGTVSDRYDIEEQIEDTRKRLLHEFHSDFMINFQPNIIILEIPMRS